MMSSLWATTVSSVSCKEDVVGDRRGIVVGEGDGRRHPPARRGGSNSSEPSSGEVASRLIAGPPAGAPPAGGAPPSGFSPLLALGGDPLGRLGLFVGLLFLAVLLLIACAGDRIGGRARHEQGEDGDAGRHHTAAGWERVLPPNADERDQQCRHHQQGRRRCRRSSGPPSGADPTRRAGPDDPSSALRAPLQRPHRVVGDLEGEAAPRQQRQRPCPRGARRRERCRRARAGRVARPEAAPRRSSAATAPSISVSVHTAGTQCLGDPVGPPPPQLALVLGEAAREALVVDRPSPEQALQHRPQPRPRRPRAPAATPPSSASVRSLWPSARAAPAHMGPGRAGSCSATGAAYAAFFCCFFFLAFGGRFRGTRLAVAIAIAIGLGLRIGDRVRLRRLLLRAGPELGGDLALQLVAQLGVVAQELLGVVAALAQAGLAVGEERSRLLIRYVLQDRNPAPRPPSRSPVVRPTRPSASPGRCRCRRPSCPRRSSRCTAARSGTA